MSARALLGFVHRLLVEERGPDAVDEMLGVPEPVESAQARHLRIIAEGGEVA